MDRNTIIGLTLIFILLMVWQQFMAPTEAEIQEQQARQDSIAQVQAREDSLKAVAKDTVEAVQLVETVDDSLALLRQQAAFGPFAAAADGEEQTLVLENDLMKVNLSSKGGRITSVLIKNHKKLRYLEDASTEEVPLYLLEDEKKQV